MLTGLIQHFQIWTCCDIICLVLGNWTYATAEAGCWLAAGWLLASDTAPWHTYSWYSSKVCCKPICNNHYYHDLRLSVESGVLLSSVFKTSFHDPCHKVESHILSHSYHENEVHSQHPLQHFQSRRDRLRYQITRTWPRVGLLLQTLVLMFRARHSKARTNAFHPTRHE